MLDCGKAAHPNHAQRFEQAKTLEQIVPGTDHFIGCGIAICIDEDANESFDGGRLRCNIRMNPYPTVFKFSPNENGRLTFHNAVQSGVALFPILFR